MNIPKPFPCPFCQSRHVALTGGGRQFAHFRCLECAEVWTAQTAGVRPRRTDGPSPVNPPEPVNTRKVSFH